MEMTRFSYNFSIAIATLLEREKVLNKIIFLDFDTKVWAALRNRDGQFFCCRHFEPNEN